MNKPKIALLVPSRERIDKKIALIESIKNTVSDLDNIKLYFGIDDDDPLAKSAEEISQKNSFVKIVNIKNEGKFLGLGKLWNICAFQAKEDILSMIGDDMLFKTKNWDAMVIDEFIYPNCPKDNIKMLYCNDGRHGKAIAVNFFIHRAYMNITGYLTREEFMVDFIDLWPQQVFNSLGRLKYRGDILIEHLHWSFRKSTKDGVSNNLRGNQYPEKSQKLWNDTLKDRIDEAAKIGKYINIVPDVNLINRRIMG